MTKEELAEQKYPTVDIMPKETGYNENDVSEKQQAAFIAGFEAAEPKWISVNDKMPDWNVNVVVLRKSGMPLIGYRQKHDYFGREVNDWNHKTVTHWMPLPKLPEQ